MILSFRHTALAALAALAATLGGCSESADIPDTEPQEILLRITVDPGLSLASRAGEAPDRFEGAAGDFEKIQTLRVIIVDGITDSDPKGTVEANRLVGTTAEGYPINDNMVFRVKTGRKRIFLIANEGSLPSPDGTMSTRAYLDSFREGYDYVSGTFSNWTVQLPGTNPSATASLYSNVAGAPGLPLTEYFDVTLESVPPEKRQSGERIENIETQSVHLFMTRAAAKVTYRIYADASYKSGTELTAIRLGGLNWAQWVLPHNTKYSPAKDPQVSFGPSEVLPAATNRFITEFTTPQRVNAVSGASVTTTLPAPVRLNATSQSGKTLLYTSDPVYFPESLFPAVASSTDMFTVNVRVGNTWLTAKPLEDNILSVPMLVNGQTVYRQGIARDTHLIVEITFSDKEEVEFRTVVAPYNSVILEPVFGLSEPKSNE